MSSPLQPYGDDDYAEGYETNRATIMKARNAALKETLEVEVNRVKAPAPKKKFWMLYAEGGGAPTHKHNDYMEAMLEAKRIMDGNRWKGSRIYVLEVTGVVEAVVTKEFVHTEITYD